MFSEVIDGYVSYMYIDTWICLECLDNLDNTVELDLKLYMCNQNYGDEFHLKRGTTNRRLQQIQVYHQ